MKTRPSPCFSVWMPLMMALAVLLLVIWSMRPSDETRPTAAETGAPPVAQAGTGGGRTIIQRARKRMAAVDLREAGDGGQSGARREQALEALRREIPGVQVEFDAITGAPKHIMAAGRFLAAAGTGAADPHAPVRAFVERHAALFGHDAAELARGRARVTREDVAAHNGMRTVVWQQEVAGLPVFETILKANVTKDGDLITLGSHFMADAPKAAEKQARLVSSPPLNAPHALAAAAASLGGALDLAQVTSRSAQQGAEQAQKLEAPGFTDTTAHLAWVPMDESTLRLAWQIETFSLQQNEMFRLLVDAEDGRILVRQSLTTDISNATYRVYAKPAFQPYDSPTPFSPGHLTPSSAQPAEVSRNAVTLDAVNTTASPNGWIDDGGTQTLGNNVDAHTDTNADNVADLPRPTSATRNFDFALDLTQAPSTYRDAAVTNLFYLCNFIHDQYYSLGFTESAGNFQTNNFGRGGNGNDAVQADAQDGSGTNNANFSTPSDGSPGRMQMYVFTGPTPDRDGDLDHEIVIHEYTHGLSNRLVGGGVGMSQNQSQGMGEGWSDFYGLCLLSEAGDDPNGNYAAGGYATKDFSGLTQNYYFGIRRYPYSTDLLKNPLTFKDIDPAQASTHAGIARSTIIGSTANEVHNEGEVWCVTLWDMRANLVAKHGWAAGNQLALQITTDAMKLCPANPNMLQSRDAIVQADLVSNAGANRNEIWAAFAKRGMGASATSPASSTTSGLVEAFDVPDNLGVSPAGALAATGLIGGPFTPASRVFTLQNSGAASVNWTASVNQPWLSLTGAAGALAAGASTTVTASFNAAANALVAGSYAATVTFTNTTSGAVITRGVSLTVEPQRITIFSEPFDAATLGAAWTVTGTSTYRTQVTALNGPRASNHLTMDSSVDASYARNEATLTVNLAGRSDVVLSFWAKSFNDEANGPPSSPFTNGADFDGVAVSADGGTTWWEVQPLRSLTSTWTKYTVDLDAAIAARGLSYGANFKIRFNQYDNYTISTDGIAIDDILVAQTLNNNLALALPASVVTEGASDMTATLTVSPAQAAALTVNLAASRADVMVPASVVVPAGATQATFPVTIVDDALLDGSQAVTITATAPTFSNGSATLTVDDNETAVLALDAPLNGNEGSSPIAATVSVGAAVDVDVVVRLDTSNPQASIPPSVTIPAGQSSAEFYITLVNDGLINGTRSATITASVTGWTAGTDTISILDDETATVALVLNDTTSEGLTGTPQIGTLTLGGTAVTPVEVTLISSDTSELTVPATITIAAGQSSAALLATVIDDADLDGSQTVTVSAAAFGNAAVTDTIDVRDNDAASFVIGAVASPQREMQAFPLTITARDVNGALVPSVAGPWTLSAAGDGGAAVLNAPTAAFVNGVWQQNVSIAAPDTNVRITVTGPNATAQSNAFDVTIGPRIGVAPAAFTLDIPRQSSKTRALTITNNGLGAMIWSAAGSQSWLTCTPASGSVAQGQSATVTVSFNAATLAEGTAAAQLNVTSNDPITPAVAVPVTLNVTAPVASFVWDTVPSPQRVNAPFPVTVTAKDASGATVTNFEGTASLSVLDVNGGTEVVTTTGTGSNQGGGPVTAGFNVLRQQFIFTPAEAGPAGLIQRIRFHVLTAFSSGLANYTIRLKHTNLTTNSTWQPSGWTVCYAQSTGPVSSPWHEFVLTTPFAYDGTSNLMVDVSYATAIMPVTGSYSNGTYASTNRALYSMINMPGSDPLTWSGTEGNASSQTWLPNFQFVTLVGGSNAAAVLPTLTGAFSLGVWSGQVRLDRATPDVKLIALMSAPSTGSGLTNSFAVTADGTLGITLASQVSEGAGTLGGTVTITPAPSADVEVTLSSSVASAAVPAATTVTVPAGSTSAPFTLNIIDDTALDGPQTTQIGAVGAGYVAVSTPLVVADDEGAVLAINLAQSSYAEGAGVISGTITSDTAPTVPVTIALTSSDTTEATVPVSVTLAAGATSAAFSVTIVDDTLVDGDQNLVLTAAVAGWASGTKNLTVTDNEARTLTFTGVPASISEGAATLATPAVALTGQAVAPVVVTLTSSDVTALPSISVTIPAGASSAVFDLDPVDDTLFDGTQNVTLTASAATFSDATANVAVLDDDVHHFALSAVPSPQKEGAGFAFTATAKDINDATITAPVGGPVNLSAAGDGGAASVLPAVLAPFTAGVWTGQVRVMAPDTNVRLTVTSPTASNQSNAFDVGIGPRLGVNPTSYAVSVAQNTTKTRSLTLNNTGAEPLNWSATTTGDIDPPLATALAGLNARHAEITALIPNRFDFTEGVTGTYISSGGGTHMYHSGNYLSTSLAPSTFINYSDNTIAAAAATFGAGGQYFTRKVPGLFVLAADMSGVSSFTISGNTGNHTGLVEGSVLTATRGAKTYKGFVKRARGDVSYGAESINHLIIIESDAAASHSWSATVDSDNHVLTGIGARTRLYYLLYSSVSGGNINDTITQTIFDKFLDVIGAGSWMTVTPSSGTVAAGGSQNVSVAFNAGSLNTGVYNGGISITSNDALTSPLTIPATMTVTPGIHHFEWDTIPSPQVVNAPVAATVRARDAVNALVTDFDGMAALTALNTGAAGEATTGAGTSSTYLIHDTSYQVHRTQCIYTPAEAGPAARLSGLAFDVATLGSPAASNFTIRLKHTVRANYSTDASWEASGWTTVFTGSKTLAAGLNYFTFSTPFDYNGTSNLMVDISFVNTTYSGSSYVRYTTATSSRTIYGGAYSGDPLAWSGAGSSSTALPNLRLVRSGVPASVSPVATGAFVNGAWTGDIRLGTAGAVVVTASAGAATGASNVLTTTSSSTLSLSIPANVTEGQGTLLNAGTVTAASAPASPLTISLESLDTSEITLPATVTLPAGQASVAFDVTVVDDPLLDGPITVQMRALAVGYPTVTATTTVADNDTTTVTLTLPASMTEGTTSTAGQASVQLGAPAAEPLTVALASSLTSRLTVPASVTIPAGQSSAAFTLTAPNNTIIDGTQTATITATLAGSVPGTGTVQVIDNENTNLTFSSGYSSVSEGAAPLTSGGYVYLSGTVTSALTISLASSDTTELTLPATITIPAGSSQSSYFAFTPVNDTLQDGSQTVTLTASASGFTSSSRTITVLDDDVHHFTVSTVASPQVKNGPFNVTFTAKDINNVTISAYAGTPTLTAADGVTPLTVTPASLTGFSSGAKTQSVMVGAFATSAVLTLTDAVTGGSGSSTAFAVGAGSLHHFAWDTVASPQMLNAAFGATLFARDVYENTISNFSGTAGLSAASAYSLTTAGTGTFTDWYPFGGYYPQNRCQMIYTPAEVGGTARKLQALAFDMTTPNTSYPAVTLSNFTIRLKHTTKTDYSTSAVWETADWTTVYQGTVNMNQTGWRQINFTTPFDYNGADRLMVDISSSNSGFMNRIEARSANVSPYRVLYSFTSSATPPTQWTGTANAYAYLPNLRLVSFQNVPMIPAQATVFSAGAWNGQVTLQAAASGVRLLASNAANGVVTNSNPFDVSYFGDLSVTLPATVVETAGSISGTVSVSVAPSSDLTVSLASSDATELLPAAASVVIPAGQTSAPFTVTVLDDADLDGDQSVQITAAAAGYQTGSASVAVKDDETTVITLAAPAAINENQGTLANAGTITLGTVVTAPVTVLLASSDTTELTVPASVVIPAGASAVSFSITAVNDTIIDLDQAVTLTASVAGWTAGAALVTVTDDEPRNLSFAFTQSATEGDAVLAATVSAGKVMGYDLTVSLASSKTGEATVPATVVIPAGQQTASFYIAIVDDALADGAQTTSITATAPAFSAGSRSLTVRDNEPHHLDISAISGPRTRNAAIPVTISLMTIDGTLVANFAGTAALVINSTGGPLGMSPAITGAFVGGVWSGDVTATDAGTGAVLTAAIAGGVAGSSNSFDVLAHGALAGLEWSPISPTQYPNVPVPVTITARDAAGNVVTDFDQTVTLTAPLGASGTRNVGSGTTTDAAPIHTGFHDCRAQEIYLPGEVGGAGRFTSLALNMTTAPPPVNLTNWTIRMKHTSRTQFGPAASDYIWETDGWTTVYSNSVALSGFAGWIKFDFSTPFDYNGTDNLLIDFSFDNSSKFSPTTFTYVAATTRTAGRRISYYSDSGHGAPLSWSGASPVAFADSRVADLRLESSLVVSMTPAVSGQFVNGVWSGSLTFPSTAAAVTVIAAHQASGLTGASSTFDVIAPPPARLAFTALPARAAAGEPFAVTITALDAAGNVTPGHTAAAALSLVNPENVTTTIGAGLYPGTVPLYAAQTDCRSQIVYKQQELGAARRLTGLALNIATTSAFVYNNFTLRLKHTGRAHFNTAPSWEGAGWTVVWQGAKTFDTAGWIPFTFSTPFDYNGTDNLMLDVSFDNTSSGTSAWLRKDPTGYDVGMIYYYSPSAGDPLSWSGNSVSTFGAVERPQLRLFSDPGITVSPASTGAFVNGVWSGNLTVVGMHPAVVLKAVAAGVSGLSDPIMVGYPAPSMLAEPAFTGGVTNQLAWNLLAGPAAYTLQRDTVPSFTNPASMTGVTIGSATFSALQDTVRYYYRVCGDSASPQPAGLNQWSQTSYADFVACTHSGTSAAVSLHDVALAAASTSTATSTENFDGGGTAWAGTIFSQAGGTATMDLQDMTTGPAATPSLPVNTGGDFEGRIGNASGFGSGYALLPSSNFADGSIEGYLAPENAAAGAGGMGAFMLRASPSATGGLQGYAGYASFGTSTAYFGIYVVVNGTTSTLGAAGFSTALTTADNLKLRLSAQGSTLTLQAWKVAVSGGVVTETPLVLESGSTSLVRTDTTFASGSAGVFANGTAVRCYFDDITVTRNAPVFVTSGAANSPLIAPPYFKTWGALNFTGDTSGSGTTLSIDVLNAAGGLLAANVATGTDLNALPAVAPQPAIKLRANLATSNSANSPRLRDWSVGYVLNPPATISSVWSNVVSSTQDATPPVISAPDLHTSAGTASLGGTALDAVSGVAGVTVAGNAAATSDSFANWNSPVTGLVNGANSITVTAADNAVPPNTATVTALVFRISAPSADADGNGISDLLQHALAIPAADPDPLSMLPAVGVQTDGGTGKKFLTLDYRRRIQRGGLTYTVETSGDLKTWTAAGGDAVEQSVTPAGDGVTENVRVRITPALDLASAKFVRLSVTVQ
ncbi:MAG: M36 family metallopeptidase [Verrucomicrobiaceae bacterium]|nr:M36 family metallopeptidase [Verrucomicrobiaceae bacterium]